MDKDQEQAELLEQYWAQLEQEPNAALPAGLDPELAGTADEIRKLLSPPDPDPDFVGKVRDDLLVWIHIQADLAMMLSAGQAQLPGPPVFADSALIGAITALTEAIAAVSAPEASEADVIDLPAGLTDYPLVVADNLSAPISGGVTRVGNGPTFGQWLRRRRIARDLTQEQLADKVGMAPDYIRKVEKDIRRPSVPLAERIAECLGVPADQIPDIVRLARSSHDVAGLVDALDVGMDTRYLGDPTDLIAGIPEGGEQSSTVHSGQVANAPEVATEVEGLEVTSEEIEEGEEPDEIEPDAAALARVGEVVEVEVERTEDFEKIVDRALNMEGISVDDPVRIYLREIGRTPLLKPPDESALAEKMALGRQAKADLELLTESIAESGLDPAELEDKRRDLAIILREGERAKQQLVSANLRLVVSIARRYIGRGLSLLDLIQEGNIGLMKAADKFDHVKGFKFSTYATWWIRQAITRAISDQSRTIRLPVHVTEMVTRLRRAAHELQQKLLREPTEEELGQELNMPAERVRKILDMARHPASLDAPMEEGEDSYLGDFIEDERTATPMEEASRQMLKEQVEDILHKLTERERQILQMRYGLTDDRPRTLEEVAKAFGITRERIRQIETRILRKLRFRIGKLRGYLE